MSVSNTVGSAVASALSPPVQKPAAPDANDPVSVPVFESTPASRAATRSLAQPLGGQVLASLVLLQGEAGTDGGGGTGVLPDGPGLSGRSSERPGAGTLETGSPDPSQALAFGAPAADTMPATTWPASSTYPAALRDYVQSAHTPPGSPTRPG